MTELQQQRAIAQWHREQVGKPLHVFVDDDGCEQEGMLDYLRDLNAMHEAEKKLTIDKRDIYEDWLRVLTDRADRMAPLSWLVLNATSAQRAEALLRTIGKWKD